MLVFSKYYCNEIKSNRNYRAKMIFFLLTAFCIIDDSSAQTSEERCDPHELTLCVNATPRTQVGLPRTTEELDRHCQAYHMGMSCMDTYIKRCLATDKQKLVQQQIGGARALMRYLCSNDTALRRDFLKEVSCWSLVSPDWSRCVDELQLASRDISDRSHHITYFNKNTEMCCARKAFVSCVGHAGRACSSAAGALLQRMAWVLAQDVAACSPAGEQPRAPCCRATSTSVGAAVLAVLCILHLETKYRACEAFVSCVGHAGCACSSAAGALLQRMAWVLAQDVAACSPAGEHPRAPCAATQPPRLSALLSLLYYVYYT